MLSFLDYFAEPEIVKFNVKYLKSINETIKNWIESERIDAIQCLRIMKMMRLDPNEERKENSKWEPIGREIQEKIIEQDTLAHFIFSSKFYGLTSKYEENGPGALQT